jgi:hypothetical protein
MNRNGVFFVGEKYTLFTKQDATTNVIVDAIHAGMPLSFQSGVDSFTSAGWSDNLCRDVWFTNL